MPQPLSSQLTYVIAGYNNTTDEEFDGFYKRQIRKTNARYPDCVYFVGNNPGCDQKAQEFLRQVGISPARVVIFWKSTSPRPVNKHHCVLYECSNDMEKFQTMMKYSTNEIMYIRLNDTDGLPARIRNYRLKSIKR